MRSGGSLKNRGFVEASFNALVGFIWLLGESAAKRELLLLMISIGFAMYTTTLTTLALIGLSVLMLVVESINTALEGLCDCITLDYDERIRKIKDLGAASVFIVSISYLVVLVRFFWEVVS